MSDTSTAEKSHAAARGGKFLTFGLGDEEYGIPILKVREIIVYMEITAVPQTPPYVKGIINLRGQVISVLDLRTRFEMPPADATDQTCIVVVEVVAERRRVCIGLVVDRVSEVLSISADKIEDTPSFGVRVDTAFILGMGKIGKSVKILLDIDKILTAAEADVLPELQAA